MNDLIQDVRDKGWTLFPVKPNSKTPLVRWREHQSTDADWINGRNYGIDCGRSGLVVVDLDTKNGIDGAEKFRELCERYSKRVPKTFRVKTPSGGTHLYFSGTGISNSAKMVAPNVDIRGDGGYVVGPGSQIDGARYEIEDDLDVMPLPDWLADAISKYSYEPLGSPVSHVWEPSAPGGQDDQLSRAVFTWRLQGKPKAECKGLWAQMVSEMPLERPSDPWTDADFERHFRGADRKISAKEAQEAPLSNAFVTHDFDLVVPKKLELTPLSDISFRKVEWAWDTTADGEYEGTGGRFPIGTICIGAGRPGAGKGQFAAWIGAQVSNGTLPGCFFGKPKGVIIYSTEDSTAMTIGPRFKAAGADLDKVYVFTRPVEETGNFAVLRIRDDLPELARLIKDKDIGLIILDPLISVMDGRTDVNSETAVRSELEPLQNLLEGLECFAFGIMHFRKAKDEDILNMVSGSGAFPRVVRSMIAFALQKDDEGGTSRVISTIKNNLGRTDLPSYTYDFQTMPVHTSTGLAHVSKLVFTGESAWSAEEINEGKHLTETAKTSVGRACDWLEMVLSDGPVAIADVKAKFSDESSSAFSWTSIERAKRKLRVTVSKDFGGKGKWSLPDVDEIDEIDEIDSQGASNFVTF